MGRLDRFPGMYIRDGEKTYELNKKHLQQQDTFLVPAKRVLCRHRS